MDLLTRYREVESVLETLDFGALFAGFHKYSYALYDSREICLDGKVMPFREGFRGNTAIEYNGAYTAIWNVEADRVDDMEWLACLLVHEMFHCHQKANGEKRYPSDLALLHYPDDIENFEKKYNENLYLAEAYEKYDWQAFQKFAQIREMRMKAHPDAVRQELKVETLEGTAEYVDLKALQRINHKRYRDVINQYLSKLRQQDDLLFDARRIAYYSGTLYYLCCERNKMVVHNDFADVHTVYEQNPIPFEEGPVEIKHYAFIPAGYAEIMEKRKKLIAQGIEQWEFTACNAFICGYDPMNMFRVGTLVYCRYFVCLNHGGDIETINAPVVLRLDEKSDRNIVGYYCGARH